MPTSPAVSRKSEPYRVASLGNRWNVIGQFYDQAKRMSGTRSCKTPNGRSDEGQMETAGKREAAAFPGSSAMALHRSTALPRRRRTISHCVAGMRSRRSSCRAIAVSRLPFLLLIQAD